MPTYDWLSEVVKCLDPWTELPSCRTCGGAITDRTVALRYAAREDDPEVRQIVRWYCSAACQATGQEKP